MANNREFGNRRVHSLLGVIPIGLFLLEHLVTNFMATMGPERFNSAAKFLEDLPFRYFLEIFIIFLPLIYHAVYGIYIAFTAKPNLGRFGFFRNWMFFLQRISGIITLIFIIWHVYTTRVQAMLGEEVNFDMMANIFSSPFMIAFYLVGVISAIFHFANGLWSFAVSWGLTVSPRSQRIMTWVTMIIFVLLSYVGVRAIFAFV